MSRLFRYFWRLCLVDKPETSLTPKQIILKNAMVQFCRLHNGYLLFEPEKFLPPLPHNHTTSSALNKASFVEHHQSFMRRHFFFVRLRPLWNSLTPKERVLPRVKFIELILDHFAADFEYVVLCSVLGPDFIFAKLAT